MVFDFSFISHVCQLTICTALSLFPVFFCFFCLFLFVCFFVYLPVNPAHSTVDFAWGFFPPHLCQLPLCTASSSPLPPLHPLPTTTTTPLSSPVRGCTLPRFPAPCENTPPMPAAWRVVCCVVGYHSFPPSSACTCSYSGSARRSDASTASLSLGHDFKQYYRQTTPVKRLSLATGDLGVWSSARPVEDLPPTTRT